LSAPLATDPPDSPLPADVLASPGAVVVAEVTQGPLDWWALQLLVIRRDAAPEAGAFNFRAPPGWQPRTSPEVVRITADGWAAIEITTEDEGAATNDGVLVIDLLGEGGASGAMPGTTPTWLPNGELLVTGFRFRVGEIVRRIADHGFGDAVEMLTEQDCILAIGHFGYVVHGDLTGIEGFDSCRRDLRPVTIRWDGTVVPRDPRDSPYLETGDERTFGASGAEILQCPGMDPCTIEWRREDGIVLSHPAPRSKVSWTRDGSAIVAMDFGNLAPLEGSNIGLIREANRDLVTKPLALLPPASLVGSGMYVVGMTDWAAVVWGFNGNVTLVPLDGSPVIGPFPGTLALVNP
jgi:hypothetical protein